MKVLITIIFGTCLGAAVFWCLGHKGHAGKGAQTAAMASPVYETNTTPSEAHKIEQKRPLNGIPAGVEKVEDQLPVPVITSEEGRSESQRTSSPAYFRVDGKMMRLGNQFLEIRLSTSNGEVVGLIDKSSGTDLRKEKFQSYHLIWGLGLRTADNKHAITDNARSGKFFRCPGAAEREGQALRLRLVWSAITLDDGQDYAAEVVADISVLDNSPMASWGLQVKNHGQHGIEDVRYPYVAGIKELGADGSDDCLVVPILEGRLFHNPAKNLNHAGNSYPSCFLNMQFGAYYDSKSGFYFAAYDNKGLTKEFFFDRHRPEWAMIGWAHWPSAFRFGSDFRLEYPVVVGVFHGDWFTAAEIYRQWAWKQWWAKRPFKDRNRPAWLDDIGVASCFIAGPWGKGNTSLETVKGHALNHRRYAQTELLTELWGWENKGAWSWGDYFPPLEGWASFDDFIGELHSNGCRLHTFIGATSLDEKTDLWKSQKPVPYAVRDQAGRLRGAAICPATQFWHEHLQQTAVELTRHQVDLIQFDCFPPIPLKSVCYATSHGHPPGPGKWTADSWVQILSNTVSACRAVNSEVCFTSEGITEIYIPFLDVAHYWRDAFSEVGLKDKDLLAGTSEIIPLFEYVYHEYIAGQGQSYLGLLNPGTDTAYSLLFLGRMLVWGESPLQNTWLDTESPRFDKHALSLWKQIGQLRTGYGKDFLLFGRMIRPPKLGVPPTSIQVNALAKSGSVPVIKAPSILHSAWRAPDGSVALAFVNITDNARSARLQVDAKTLGLSEGKTNFIYAIRDGKVEILDLAFKDRTALDISLSPAQVLLVGFCDTKGARAAQIKELAPSTPPPK